MIKQLRLQNFRGLQDLQLQEFTQVVVFVGPNGCGKTSLMEGLHIACQPFVGLMRAIEGGLRRQSSAQWLTSEGRFGQPITIETERSQVSITIETAEMIRVEVRTPAGKQPQELFKSEGLWKMRHSDALVVNRSLPDLPSVKTSGPFDQASLEDRFSDAAKFGFREKLRHLIRQLLAPATDLEILLEDQQPLLYAIYPEFSVPIDLVGEGIRTAIEVVCALAAPPRSLVLLEEPERHQHPRSLGLTCRAIWNAATQGQQIFISTHSLEFLDYLLTTADTHLGDLTLFRLRKSDKKIQGIPVVGEDLKEARTLLMEDLR